MMSSEDGTEERAEGQRETLMSTLADMNMLFKASFLSWLQWVVQQQA